MKSKSSQSIMSNVVGYAKKEASRISDALDRQIGGMSKAEAAEYFSGKHDEGFYGHLKSGSIKSGKLKGECK